MSRTEKALITGSTRFLTIAALLWVLAAPAAAVEVPADQDWGPTLAVLNGAGVEAVLFNGAPAKGASIGGPNALGTVTADCCDGSTVTCEGSSGHFKDFDCGSGEPGFCETDEERKDCPDCSWCTSCANEPLCEEAHGTPCTSGETMECSFSDGSCGQCDCFFGDTWTCTL